MIYSRDPLFNVHNICSNSRVYLNKKKYLLYLLALYCIFSKLYFLLKIYESILNLLLLNGNRHLHWFQKSKTFFFFFQIDIADMADGVFFIISTLFFGMKIFNLVFLLKKKYWIFWLSMLFRLKMFPFGF